MITQQQIDDLLASLNIVDVINNSGLNLRKEGKEHVCCCPFHAEKSPSFKVNEVKQMYYCFGCGAKGNAISFVMDFQKVEFPEACKMLGADIAATPSETIRRNINRVVNRLPSYDKRDAELCAKLLENAEILESNYNSYYSIDGNFYQSVIDEDMNIVNLYNLVDGSFVAGGVSHLAVTQFLFNTKYEHTLIVSDYNNALKIAKLMKGVNIFVSHSPYNTKLIFDNVTIGFIPVLCEDETLSHGLTDRFDWMQFDVVSNKLTLKDRGVDFD